MSIGNIVYMPRVLACLAVYSHWASQISFRKDHTKRDKNSL